MKENNLIRLSDHRKIYEDCQLAKNQEIFTETFISLMRMSPEDKLEFVKNFNTMKVN